MLPEHHFVIPDRIFFGLSGLVVIGTLVFVVWANPLLPASLPLHFNAAGQADDFTTSRFMTLWLPVLMQGVFILLISWAYRHPRYMNFPTRRPLQTLPLPVQAALQSLGRHMLVVLLLISVLIMAHLAEGVVVTGFGLPGAPDPAVMVGLVIFLVLVLATYTLWMRRLIRQGTTTASGPKR